MFGHVVGTIAKCRPGICTVWETVILSSMTACEAIAMTLPLYSVNLLLSSVHPSLKQWWLRKSSSKMKGLVMPLHTMNLCVKLHDPILKFIITDPLTSTSWLLAVLMHILLLDIWCKIPISVMVSYLMQLTCTPVSKRDENTRSFTFILKVVPFVFLVFIKIPLFPPYCHLHPHPCSFLLVRPMNFPIFRYFCSCSALMPLFLFGLQLHQRPEWDYFW